MSIALKPEWKTFNDYMQALSSKYRVRAKKVYSLCKEHQVRSVDMSLTDIEQHQERIFALYGKAVSYTHLDVYKRQQVPNWPPVRCA